MPMYVLGRTKLSLGHRQMASGPCPLLVSRSALNCGESKAWEGPLGRLLVVPCVDLLDWGPG